MGQGNHVRIVFGTVEVPDVEWDSFHGDYRETPDTAYESRQPWCGFTVAADQGMADSPAMDLERFAVPLDGLITYIEQQAPEAVKAARERWDAWRAKHPEFPEGRLLFVAEYD
jgi:hypothetical protein